jgi:YesN/AraC family two-component response regulator
LKYFKAALQAYDIKKAREIIAPVIDRNMHIEEIAGLVLTIEEALLNPLNLRDNCNKDEIERQRILLHGGIQNAISILEVKENILKSIVQIIRFCKHIPEESHKKPVQDAIKFIGQYYMQQLSLEQIADHVGLNRVYFSNLFKMETGDTFIGYLNKVKIEKAKELLMQTNENISEIAYAVGLNDPAYFSRLFRRYAGISPLKYRYTHS